MTLEDLVFERVGLMRAAWVAVPLGLWVATARKLGKFPTTEEFAAAAGVSERTGWRYRARIHAAFPGDEMQDVVMAAAAGLADGQNPLTVDLPGGLRRAS